jgi:hypothetical protein
MRTTFITIIFLLPAIGFSYPIDTIPVTNSITPIRINIQQSDTVGILFQFKTHIYGGVIQTRLITSTVNASDSGQDRLFLSYNTKADSGWFFPNHGITLPIGQVNSGRDTAFYLSTLSNNKIVIAGPSKVIIRSWSPDSASMDGWIGYIKSSKPWIQDKKITWFNDTASSGDTVLLTANPAKYAMSFYFYPIQESSMIFNQAAKMRVFSDKKSKYFSHSFNLLGRKTYQSLNPASMVKIRYSKNHKTIIILRR